MAQSQLIATRGVAVARIERRFNVRILIALSLLGMLGEYISGHWDANSHLHGGVDGFWYPPHFGIYGGLLLAALTATAGAVLALREPGTLAQKIRNNAALLFVAAMNLLNFTGAPFDAWYHTVYGIDLTVWSPPHIHLLIGFVLTPVACAVFFMPAIKHWSTMQHLAAAEWAQLALWIFSLLAAGMLFIEYDIPGRLGSLMRERPDWIYPLLQTCLVLLAGGLIQYASKRIGMVTAAATGYIAIRAFMSLVIGPLAAYPLLLPQPIVVPALVLDLALLISIRRGGMYQSIPRILAAGFLGALAEVAISPLFALLTNAPVRYPAVQPWLTYAPQLLAAGVLSYALGTLLGRFLRTLIPEEKATPAPAGRQA